MDHDDRFQPPPRATDPFSDHPGSDPRGFYNASAASGYPDPYASNVSLSNPEFNVANPTYPPQEEEEKLLYPGSFYPPKYAHSSFPLPPHRLQNGSSSLSQSISTGRSRASRPPSINCIFCLN